MKTNNQAPKHKRSLLAKIGRGFAIFLLSLVTLVILLLILIQTAPVQNFARKKIVSFLQKKLDTRVEIARLDIDFPKMLVLEGVYIEDKTKDTLVAGHQLKVDIDMYKLIHSEIQINEINLNGITAKVKRQLPDTTFNFQFIVDAFATEPTEPKTESAPLKMAIEKIIVDKTRLVYKDVITGNDVDIYLNHFDTRITKFDLNNIAFEVPSIKLEGLRGRIKQSKPLLITAVVANPDSTKSNEAPAFLKFANKEILLSDIDVDYSNDVSALSTRMLVGSLNIYPETFDLEKSVVTIKEIALNKLDGTVKMGKGANTDAIKITNENNQEVTAPLPWKVRINSIKLDDNNFKFDDETKPGSKGMDFAHLDMKDLTFHLKDFVFNKDTISGEVTEGNMTEKSGFNLKIFETKFAYTNTGVSLQDILIQTPGTEIKRSAVMRYPSLAAIQKNIGLLELDLDIPDSKIHVKDILTFVPALAAQPAFKNPNSTIYLSSRIRGSVSRLMIDKFQFRGLQETNIDVAGVVYGLPDPNKVSADLKIRQFKTGRRDIMSLAPPNTIPPNITIPEALSLTGTIKGNASQAAADLSLNTTLGSARVKGTINNATNKATAKYNATISANRLNLGTLTKNPQMLGLLTANFAVDGRGFDPEKAQATVKGNIVSADIKQYVYRNLKFDAAIANQHVKAYAAMQDPNLHFALQAEGDMGGDLPGFNLVADIDSIKTQPLKLTPNAIFYRGKIEANFPQLNLDALEGQAYITKSLLVMDGQKVDMDSVSLIASHQNNEQVIDLRTDFVNANIRGQYKLEQLGNIMMETVQPYFAINTSAKPVYTDPYNFTINASVVDHPTLRAFVPTITRLDPITITATLSNGEGLNADIKVPYVAMGTNKIEDLAITANTTGDALNFTTTVQEVTSGSSVAIHQTRLSATLANNQINFGLLIKDKTAKNKYNLNGLLALTPDKNYSLQLRPDSLLLNYDQWTIAPQNMIRFGTSLINASNFALSKNNQQLIINSTTTDANSPLEVRFANFNIATITGFVQSDSLIADGNINGNVMLRNLQTQPTFTTDLTINDLAINKDTLGNLNAKVNNDRQDVFETNVTLTGKGNDLSLTGNYYMKPANNSNLDFILDIKKIELQSLEGPSMGMIKNADGYLSGKVTVNGAVAAPKVLGGISFNQTAFTVSMLNSEFRVDDETIKVDNEGIKFSTFTIKDSANNSLVIDGSAKTTNFTNYKFDMTVQADNFRAINSTKRDNPPYYGQLYFNTAMNIKGTETSPVVDGSLRINENTNFTIVLPQAEPGIVDRKGVIEFVDMDAPENDSIYKAMMAMYDSSFNKSQLTGFDISANIEVVKEATFNVIVDEGNGDFLRLKGEAILNGGIDPSGKMTMTGSYVIDEGGYELSFNFLRRRFAMKKGGKITWTGEPTTADIDITAVYIANTSSLDLVGDQVDPAVKNTYMQKLPFEVNLNVTGQLMQPILTFDIVLPTDKNLRVSNEIITTVNTRLDQIRQEPSELNKQVFALLLLNRFVSENPFESSGGGGGFNAGVYARQSVSKILTEQLNKLATDLVAGVEINFDVNSTEDYTTGEMRNRTDFNVNLSKRLLNDRLKVTVGSNFELEGPQQSSQSGSNVLGNVSVDYNLTKDGRYLLRGYRKNDYDAIVEGFVIETGLRFVMTVDYSRFRQIFQNRKNRRIQKRAEKQLEDSTKTMNTTLNTNTPETDKKQLIEFTEKTAADDRKNLPVSGKASNDEN